MNLNLGSLLAKTSLKNKRKLQQFLEAQGYTTLSAIDNLPGRYGQPWLYENGTNEVVVQLRQAVKEASSVPTIDEAIKVIEPEPEPEPKKDVLLASTPVTDLKIDGVSERQLKSIEESGIRTVGELFESENSLEEVPGIGKMAKDRILQAVTEALEKK
jgi:hypothetical protein